MGMQVGNSSDVKSEINVTPLVDVCLVLLIIFMVITPLLQIGRGVRIPSTGNPDKKPHDEKQVTISMEKSGDIYLDKDLIMASQLVARLADIRLKSQEKRIMIKADKDLNYGAVKTIMMKCNDAGFTNVGLIVEKIKKAGE
jgi:biopolymer transport protein ExbD